MISMQKLLWGCSRLISTNIINIQQFLFSFISKRISNTKKFIKKTTKSKRTNQIYFNLHIEIPDGKSINLVQGELSVTNRIHLQGTIEGQNLHTDCMG